jgi:hypothetical protein
MRKIRLFPVLIWITVFLAACTPAASPVPPAVTGSAMPVPTRTVASPTPVSESGTVEPYAGAPECPTHDPNEWHGLWDAVRGCHYNHEHGDDPSLADAYFGKVGVLWGGQTIAYPFTSSDHENMDVPHGKHAGFKYVVRTPEFHPYPPCGTNDRSDLTGEHSDNCVIAVRAQLHVLGSIMDIATRYHSGFAEVYACRPPYNLPRDCGTFQTGGLIDWGQVQSPHYDEYRIRPAANYSEPAFTIDFGEGIGKGIVMSYTSDNQYPDLPNRSGEPYVFGRLYSPEELEFYRTYIVQPPWTMDQWSSNDGDCEPRPAEDPCHNRFFHILYQVGDAWTLVDPVDIRNVHFICETGKPCHYNGSMTGVNETFIHILPEWDGVDGKQDGFVTWSGYSDKFGNPRFDNSCTTVARDCVPMVLNHVPAGMAATSIDACGCDVYEHDIYFDGQPSGWIEFPN